MPFNLFQNSPLYLWSQIVYLEALEYNLFLLLPFKTSFIFFLFRRTQTCILFRIGLSFVDGSLEQLLWGKQQSALPYPKEITHILSSLSISHMFLRHLLSCVGRGARERLLWFSWKQAQEGIISLGYLCRLWRCCPYRTLVTCNCASLWFKITFTHALFQLKERSLCRFGVTGNLKLFSLLLEDLCIAPSWSSCWADPALRQIFSCFLVSWTGIWHNVFGSLITSEVPTKPSWHLFTAILASAWADILRRAAVLS